MNAIPTQLAKTVSRRRYVRAIRVNLTAASLIALDRACRAYQTSASHVVRHVLNEYLAHHADAINAALGDTVPGANNAN